MPQTSQGVADIAAMEDWSAWAPQLLNVQKMLAHRGYGAVRPLMHGADPLLVCSCRAGAADTVFV